jgi:hypothetical protein
MPTIDCIGGKASPKLELEEKEKGERRKVRKESPIPYCRCGIQE